MRSWFFAVAVAAVTLAAVPHARATSPEAAAALARAKTSMGFARVGQRVLHANAVETEEQNYQSDRSYPPFFAAMYVLDSWLDPQSAVVRTTAQITYPGAGAVPTRTTLTDAARAFGEADGRFQILAQTSMQSRYLDAWAVIAEWAAADDAHVIGHEPYRDYPRVVLERATPGGTHRLFLDPKTGFPVKLDFDEKHYLWGQRHIEYVYSNWFLADGIRVPGSSFRLADGKTERSRTTRSVELISRDTAPALALPATPERSTETWPGFLRPIDPTVEQIGSRTYLLSNPGYTTAVTQAGNEIFVLDATQGEARARKDHALIAKLFPGQHKVNVVVTDLAWPHIAGVRYWVANGATIIAHEAAQAFLQRVVDRRWTLEPDLLEQRRASAELVFVPVDRPHRAAEGAISLHPIDGIASEVALIAYVAADRFLWASDYIQSIAEPSVYASEVWRAVRRDGLRPERAAAQHLPLTEWAVIEALQPKNADNARRDDD